jgi:hypothetical protein
MATDISSEYETYTLKGSCRTYLQKNDDNDSPGITGGLKVVEHFFQVPLDYSNPSGEKIVVFARQTIPTAKAKTKADEDKLPFGVLWTSSTYTLSHHACTVLYLKGMIKFYYLAPRQYLELIFRRSRG